MPEISRFFGIVIAMFLNDQDPPHVPVRCGDQRALGAIETLTVLRGNISPGVLGLVVEWASRHERELMEDGELARAQQQLRPIEPLE